MKNPEVLADMHATIKTMMIFSNSLDPNESIFKTGKISISLEKIQISLGKSGEMVGLK